MFNSSLSECRLERDFARDASAQGEIAVVLERLYDFGMSTLKEIELAADQLTASEKQQLLVFLLRSLRAEGQTLPEPRKFSKAQIDAWMDEDDRGMEQFRKQG